MLQMWNKNALNNYTNHPCGVLIVNLKVFIEIISALQLFIYLVQKKLECHLQMANRPNCR